MFEKGFQKKVLQAVVSFKALLMSRQAHRLPLILPKVF
jgi:hypothetical protein